MERWLRGRYDIQNELHEGGFGKTFLAIDHAQPNHPYCVVKQLQPQQANNPKVQELFKKEAQILKTLGDHPQIPQFVEEFIEHQNFYIVQEWIDGGDLGQEITFGKQHNERYVVELLRDILTVVSFVHQHNVIHRDIKPSNLIRSKSGTLFLIDFGAVKQISSVILTAEETLATGTKISTPGFAPREQDMGKACLASDVYAVGVTAIYALTGIHPTDLPINPALALVGSSSPQISQPLKKLLEQMTKIYPEQRFKSATQALNALNQIYPDTQALSPPFPNSPLPTKASSTLGNAPAKSQFGTAAPKRSTVAAPKPSLGNFPIAAQTQGNLIAIKTASPQQPVQQQPNVLGSSQPFQPRVLLNRRKFLAWVGWTGAGAILFASAGKLLPRLVTKLLLPEPTAVDFDNLPTKKFNVVEVNDIGEVSNRQKTKSAEYFTENLGEELELVMIKIPDGQFLMGSPNTEVGHWEAEGPQRTVTVPTFFIGQFQVTQAQYQAVMGRNPSRFSKNGASRPVEQVSWRDATKFCDVLSKHTGRLYRLPSEAEWEYACRAGTTTPFHFGTTITTELANYNGNSAYGSGPKGEYRNQTTIVGSFPPNAFGLYDMHGNVYEWCQDSWHMNYQGAPTDGSAWLEVPGGGELIRGGSWLGEPLLCRSAHRNFFTPESYDIAIGFRVVCEMPTT